MKKKLLLITGTVLLSAILIGCEERAMYYKGQVVPKSHLEEIIADELEIENPHLDINIHLFIKDEED